MDRNRYDNAGPWMKALIHLSAMEWSIVSGEGMEDLGIRIAMNVVNVRMAGWRDLRVSYQEDARTMDYWINRDGLLLRLTRRQFINEVHSRLTDTPEYNIGQ